MTGDPLPLGFGEHHEHLRLSAVVRAGDRRRVPQGFRRSPRYSDRGGHARDLRDQVTRLTTDYQSRSPVLGVEPNLVLRVHLNREIDPVEFERAGMRVLDMSEDGVVIAFADDPSMTAFEERRGRYEAGREDDDPDRAAPLEGFFDAIDLAEPWNPTDCVTSAARGLLASVASNQMVRIDLQCWCPEDRSEAERIRGDVRHAVEVLGGQILDAYLNDIAGLSLMRAELRAEDVFKLAAIDRLHRLDVLPSPGLGIQDVRTYPIDSLPVVLEPAPEAPIVAVIDSGIRSAHPLLASAVVGAETVSEEIATGEDATGHGTHVASVALYGAIEPLLLLDAVQPAGRLLSVRVLDDEDRFPSAELWEHELSAAIEYAAAQGAKIVNLSIGDPRSPYRGTRPTAAAAIVDQLCRQHGLVAVIAVGNVYPHSYSGSDELVGGYLHDLVTTPEMRLLDPSPAALALSVGGLCPSIESGAAPLRESVRELPLGQPLWPSPATRTGPGIGGMVKPELVAPAGNYNWDPEMRRVAVGIGVVGADAEAPERLLGHRVGVSHAAPHVSHVVLRTAGEYPTASANLLRALVLQSAEPTDVPLDEGTPAATAKLRRRLTGFGGPDVDRAAFSSDFRSVLVAEGAIPLDGVHIYRVPMPSSFFESGGWRRITIGLAYDPPVRVTRLDYLGSRMMFALYKGVDLETVEEAYLRQLAEEAAEGASGLDMAADEDDEEYDPGPKSLGSALVDLQPAARVRSAGTNQWATKKLSHRLSADVGDEMLLVVRNVNGWDATTAEQPYAIAIALEREEGRTPIYAELAARLQVEVEVEVEELQAELQT